MSPIPQQSFGSIPAHAGEPQNSGDRWLSEFTRGLSPHTRGNPLRILHSQSVSIKGSIPAHAGEPEQWVSKPCLETMGLSPHTRGNLGVRQKGSLQL